MQKDCDNLQADKEEVDQKCINYQRQLEAERAIHEEQANKYRLKLKKNEQKMREQENVINDLRAM